jgi:ribosomal-protein-alanine N-acetyltransferase
MNMRFENYDLAPIHNKDAWRICDFMVSNNDRFKDYFPGTLKENLNPTLSQLFVARKVKEFAYKEEFLFTIKENTNKSIVGLIYVKELQKREGQGELAYCLGYQSKGKSLMSTFIKKIISWCFTDAGLNTLQIIAHKKNIASINVAVNNNFVWKKTLPEAHQIHNGNFVDMELFELYKELSGHY